MERESFIFYASFYRAIKQLDNDTDRLNAFTAIIDYWIYWIEADEKKVGKMPYIIFLMAKPQIDANNKRYVDGIKWWQYWHLWWAPKGNKNAVKNWDNVSKQPHTVE